MISRALYFFACMLAASAAWAQRNADAEYPARHMRLIVPFAPGGPVDIVARPLAERLTNALGHNVVVDNRPGANGIIGIDLVAKASPDGYTMLMHSGAFTGNIVLYKKLPYDGLRDFTPITQLTRLQGLVLLVNAGLPAQTVKDLIALEKSRPGKLSYGSSGAGTITHLVAELFNASTGTRLLHVPYKGSSPALTDVIGRQIEITFASPGFAHPFVKDGRVRALGLSGTERSQVLPDVPTFKELGFGDIVMTAWYGLWFPARTPQARVNRIHATVKQILAAPEMKARLDELGLVVVGSTPAEFAKFLQQDIGFQAGIVKRAGIEPL